VLCGTISGTGLLKKSGHCDEDSVVAPRTSLPAERNRQDISVADIFGIAASRIEERSAAARGELQETPLQFENAQALPSGGVLLLVPFLIETGLLSYQNHYKDFEKGYYDIDFIVLLLAFMYLCRIKNPEQLKSISPGDYGKLLGVDRVPEARCLRGKLKELSDQGQAQNWNTDLAKQWMSAEENEFYYIDGHVQVYHGYKAHLGKKHVSRQKLCLPGMQEFWVNNAEGMPYFYVSGQVNEKLKEMIMEQIIPMLLNEAPIRYSDKQLAEDPDLALFTIVFDREAYSPVFFQELWHKYRVAVITYRKNVKDQWPEDRFSSYTLQVEGSEVVMNLAEQAVTLNDVPLREIRKSSDDHQTSVITTNRKLKTEMIALYMFARWSQENFFRYMRQNYDFDKMIQYAVDQINGDFKVANPAYNKINYQLKKLREKISRKKAALYNLVRQNVDQPLEETSKNVIQQTRITQQLDELLLQESTLTQQRSALTCYVKIKDMPYEIRYNKLHQESKFFQNITKMICYRAETSFATLLGQGYKKSINEKRAFAKSVIKTPINLLVDEENKILQVEMYSQATPRDNLAVKQLCEKLNQTQTIYPGTNLTLNYKFAT
jgi:hypothetical protein